MTKDKNQNEDSETSSNRFRDLPDWSQEFTEHLEDEEVPALRDTPANTSQDSDPERPIKVVSRKHSVKTHSPRDRNCEICKRTKITMAPCRKRTGEAVPRAEDFGDLITANHKVLNAHGIAERAVRRIKEGTAAVL